MIKSKIKFLFILICTVQFLYLFFYRSNFNLEVLKNSFKKDYGRSYVVSNEVNKINKILIKNSINNFDISDILKNNVHLYQRIVEFNYPIKIKENSEFIIILKNEELPCNVVENGTYVKLLKC